MRAKPEALVLAAALRKSIPRAHGVALRYSGKGRVEILKPSLAGKASFRPGRCPRTKRGPKPPARSSHPPSRCPPGNSPGPSRSRDAGIACWLLGSAGSRTTLRAAAGAAGPRSAANYLLPTAAGRRRPAVEPGPGTRREYRRRVSALIGVGQIRAFRQWPIRLRCPGPPARGTSRSREQRRDREATRQTAGLTVPESRVDSRGGWPTRSSRDPSGPALPSRRVRQPVCRAWHDRRQRAGAAGRSHD